MVGHSDTVRCVQMLKDKQIVISGSYDESLKIWWAAISVSNVWQKTVLIFISFRCLSSGRCLNTLRGHRGRVLCIHVSQGPDVKTFLSGSADKTIKVN